MYFISEKTEIYIGGDFMEKKFENLTYDTNDLKIAEYEYQYNFYYNDSYGENRVTVRGKRTGVIYPCGEHFVDLISGFLLNKDSIVSEINFNIEDTVLSYDKIESIFETLEETLGCFAYEYRFDRTLTCGSLCSCVPYDITFKASEIKRGLMEEFKNRVIVFKQDKEPKCELDRWIQNVKNKIKRKK